MKPTRAELKEIIDYDSETGNFFRFWKGKPDCKRIGVLKKHGYIVFQVNGHRDYAHRFAWLFMTGKWPTEIDHINGDRSDNRWENLRKTTRFLNNGNRKKHRGKRQKNKSSRNGKTSRTS